MEQVTLPGGTVLRISDKVKYRTNLGNISHGVITDFRGDVGERGWMKVDDEWVSLWWQLRFIGENDILSA